MLLLWGEWLESGGNGYCTNVQLPNDETGSKNRLPHNDERTF